MRIGDVLRMPDADLHVPALCDVEVAAGTIEDYLDLPLRRHGH